MFSDVFQGGRFAEARHVCIFPCVLFTTPGMIGIGNLLNLGVGQLTTGSIHQLAHLAGVNEQHLSTPVT